MFILLGISLARVITDGICNTPLKRFYLAHYMCAVFKILLVFLKKDGLLLSLRTFTDLSFGVCIVCNSAALQRCYLETSIAIFALKNTVDALSTMITSPGVLPAY